MTDAADWIQWIHDMKIYTTATASKVLKVSRKTVQKWFDMGHINGYKLPGGDRRIPEDCLKRFMKRHKLPMSLLKEKE